MRNKKSLSLIIGYLGTLAVLTIILLFSYSFYESSKEEYENLEYEQIIKDSMLMIRSDILKIQRENVDHYIYYPFEEEILIEVTDSNFTGLIAIGGKNYNFSVKTLGIDFCSDYSFASNEKNTFYLDNGCIRLK